MINLKKHEVEEFLKESLRVKRLQLETLKDFKNSLESSEILSLNVHGLLVLKSNKLSFADCVWGYLPSISELEKQIDTLENLNADSFLEQIEKDESVFYDLTKLNYGNIMNYSKNENQRTA